MRKPAAQMVPVNELLSFLVLEAQHPHGVLHIVFGKAPFRKVLMHVGCVRSPERVLFSPADAPKVKFRTTAPRKMRKYKCHVCGLSITAQGVGG